MKPSRALLAAPLLFAGLLFAATRPTPSQDVMKVAADSHQVILENDQVRVLSVHIKPGQGAPMHSHPANVAYFLTDAKVKITLPDGKSTERDLKGGTALWSNATTHAVVNVGTTELQEIQIELKAPVTTK